jgi:hypothetical protein
MTIRPDPTFHASPKLAMEAPIENFVYTLLLSPDFSKPDALTVIDVKPGWWRATTAPAAAPMIVDSDPPDNSLLHPCQVRRS